MASDSPAAQTTEQHRQAQVALQAAFLAQFLPLWPMLSWTDLDHTFPHWVRSAKALIRSFRQESAHIAANYYRRLRNVELPLATTPAPDLVFAPATVRFGELRIDWASADKAAERSLLVTGPSELKRRAGRGEPEGKAKRNGLVVASGSAVRHVSNGGRQAVLTLVDSDQAALGWARVTDSDPCAFCALLASRGPVYRSRETASFLAHDHCACTATPVFSRAAAWPGRAREFDRLYKAVAQGQQDPLNAFRRAYEAKRREAARPQPLSA